MGVVGQNRKVRVWSMSSKGRFINVARLLMAVGITAIWVRGMRLSWKVGMIWVR